MTTTRTQYYTASTLDGFIATEDDSLDWLFPLGDVNETSYSSFIANVGALAMGSSTYEWMLRNAEAVKEQMGTAWPYQQPTWVFTKRTLPVIEGADLTFVKGDVRHVHEAMRQARARRISGSLAAVTSPVSSMTPACSTRCLFRSGR